MNDRSSRTNGEHALADFWWDIAWDDELLNAVCIEAMAACHLEVLDLAPAGVVPRGLAIVWIFDGGHFSLRTYPDDAFASIDCYMQGVKGSSADIIKYLLKHLNPDNASVLTIARGEKSSVAPSQAGRFPAERYVRGMQPNS